MESIISQIEDLLQQLPDNPDRIDEDVLSEIRNTVVDILNTAKSFKKDLNKLA